MTALTKTEARGCMALVIAVLGAFGGLVYVPDHQGGGGGKSPPGVGLGFATGKVVGVHDGDTITVFTGSGPQIKVRFQGIDAPELKQAFGRTAKEALSSMVFGREVKLAVREKDRYGRSLATVTVDGMDVNLAMVRSGLAWHYTAYSKDPALAAAEKEARSARRGLWAEKSSRPPWEFRKRPG